MRSLRRFLSPGWVIGVLAVSLFAWACFTLLAPWQLDKSGDLDARNARLAESVEAEPAPLSEVLNGPDDFIEREWRLVTLEGRWQPESEALLRMRAIEGEQVFHVLTVFAAEDGQEILVDRGWVPVGEDSTVPDYPGAPEGPVEITSRLRATETGPSEPVPVGGLPAVRVIDPAVLGETLGHNLTPEGFLQLSGDQPGSLNPAPIPGIESGPYLSYGLQWLLFGALAPLALIYFAWAELRARRRDAEEASGVAPPEAGEAPSGDTDAASATGSAAGNEGVEEMDEVALRARAMRARYGVRDDAEHRRARRRADRLRT